MANNEEEKKVTKKITEKPIIEPIKTEELQKNSVHKHRHTKIIAPLIAVLAIIMAAWSVYSINKLQKTLTDQQAELQTELEQIRQSRAESQTQVDTSIDQINQSNRGLQNKLDQLNKQLQIAMNQRLYQNQDWLLLKARYYLELAQINAHWSDNYTAAISLLEQADKLVQQLPSSKMYEVRQAIAKEIALLKATPRVDIAGVLSQLDAAQTSINDLTIQTTVEENKPESSSVVDQETPHTANPSAWQTRLQDSVNLLEKMVIIRRDDEPVKPLMSPLYESLLRESIRLNLQEAQWAILNNNPVVYQLALKQAIMNLKRTFNTPSQKTTALLKQLNELQQIKIVEEKPVMELALPLLNKLIDNKELLTGNPTENNKGAKEQ